MPSQLSSSVLIVVVSTLTTCATAVSQPFQEQNKNNGTFFKGFVLNVAAGYQLFEWVRCKRTGRKKRIIGFGGIWW